METKPEPLSFGLKSGRERTAAARQRLRHVYISWFHFSFIYLLFSNFNFLSVNIWSAKRKKKKKTKKKEKKKKKISPSVTPEHTWLSPWGRPLHDQLSVAVGINSSSPVIKSNVIKHTRSLWFHSPDCIFCASCDRKSKSMFCCRQVSASWVFKLQQKPFKHFTVHENINLQLKTK